MLAVVLIPHWTCCRLVTLTNLVSIQAPFCILPKKAFLSSRDVNIYVACAGNGAELYSLPAGFLGIAVLFVRYIASDDGAADESADESAAQSQRNKAEPPSAAPAALQSTSNAAQASLDDGQESKIKKEQQQSDSDGAASGIFGSLLSKLPFSAKEKTKEDAERPWAQGMGQILGLLRPAQGVLGGIQVDSVKEMAPEARIVTDQRPVSSNRPVSLQSY